jgi:NADP-reducing hydrogenase subunit HndB
MAKLTKEELDRMNAGLKKDEKNWIKVGMSTCGIAAGADVVFKTFVEEAKKRNLSLRIRQCGCAGMCSAEPLVEVCVDGMPTVTYGRVDADIAVKILEKHVCGGMLVKDHIYDMNIKRS